MSGAAQDIVVGQGSDVLHVVRGGMPSGAVFAIIMVSLLAGTAILWPLVRAFARRIEGRNEPDPVLLDEVEGLRQRVGQLEELQQRVAELEERAEFAERILIQNRDLERLPGGESK